jgi:epoxide hydrolase-like predicted phosphatase
VNTHGALRGLIVDWGGVLTTDIGSAVGQWAAADGIDLDDYQALMGQWFGDAVALEARLNPVHALERGELSGPDFERRLAEGLAERAGRPIQTQGLLDRMFAYFEHAPDMTGLVLRARHAGLRTALLSNSWGNSYPRDGWAELFDVVVISGEVGMRKPEPEIFAHTLDLIGLAAHECVFVDDLAPNVAAAVELGLVGVRHRSYDETATELEALFGLPLRD